MSVTSLLNFSRADRIKQFLGVSTVISALAPVNCECSGVIYIDIPKKLHKEISEYKGTVEGPGTIVFLYGEDARHCQTMKTFVPVTGDFYMFPYMLRHAVNPHKSNCERVSIGVNFNRKGEK